MSESFSAWAELRLAHALVTGAVARVLESEGIGPAEAFALYRLATGPANGLRMSVLADSLAMVQSGITRVIDRLEERGWAVREQPRDNRRTVYASLTPVGEEVLRRVQPLLEAAIDERLGAALTPDELAHLRRLLQRVVDHNRDVDGASYSARSPRATRLVSGS